MKEIINYYLRSLASSSESLKKKSILVEKPWALIDEDGEIQKLIFKRDNGLILSKNGKVTEGNWEYYPEAKALLINRVNDKILLKEQYIDENVMILKKDGTDNDFFALANENSLPNYNIIDYLHSLKKRKFNIREFILIDGCTLQVYNMKSIKSLNDYYGKKVEIHNKTLEVLNVDAGLFMSKEKRFCFNIYNNLVIAVYINHFVNLPDGSTFEIIGGNKKEIYKNLNKKVTFNGQPISDSRIKDKNGYYYDIKDGKILSIIVINEYETSDGKKINIEQKNSSKIT
ncbi:MAG: hypothetical protein ACOCWM_05500, partial [Cyclobacteriaceae bacterium]